MNKPKVTWGMFRELTKDIPDDELDKRIAELEKKLNTQ